MLSFAHNWGVLFVTHSTAGSLSREWPTLTPPLKSPYITPCLGLSILFRQLPKEVLGIGSSGIKASGTITLFWHSFPEWGEAGEDPVGTPVWMGFYSPCRVSEGTSRSSGPPSHPAGVCSLQAGGPAAGSGTANPEAGMDDVWLDDPHPAAPAELC